MAKFISMTVRILQYDQKGCSLVLFVKAIKIGKSFCAFLTSKKRKSRCECFIGKHCLFPGGLFSKVQWLAIPSKVTQLTTRDVQLQRSWNHLSNFCGFITATGQLTGNIQRGKISANRKEPSTRIFIYKRQRDISVLYKTSDWFSQHIVLFTNSSFIYQSLIINIQSLHCMSSVDLIKN